MTNKKSTDKIIHNTLDNNEVDNKNVESENEVMINRPGKEEYYLNIAYEVAKRSTCIRRMYGAVIVKNDEIISTGYNGSPRGVVNCCDKGTCKRNDLGVKPGEHYEYCLSRDTKVKLLNGEEVTIKELSEKKKYKDGFWLYAVDPKTREIVPAMGYNAHATKKVNKILKIMLDHDAVIKCTEDHKIMLRDGSYKKAKDLKYGDSVMPMYFNYSKYGHESVSNGIHRKRDLRQKEGELKGETSSIETHILVYKYTKGDIEKGNDIHHKDFNKLNNTPDNLVEISKKEHGKEHGSHANKETLFGGKDRQLYGSLKHAERLKNDLEYRKQFTERSRELMNANWNNEEFRKRSLERSKKLGKKLSEKYNSDHEICKKRHKTLVARDLSNLLFLMETNSDDRTLTIDNYNEIRKEYVTHDGKGINRISKLKSILKNYDSLEEAIDAAKKYNHKVIKIEEEKYKGYVYDLEVPKFHNFAIKVDDKSCVFVHNCSSVHAEQNAIISAKREDTIGATLYLAGIDYETGEKITAEPCIMCKRFIVNAGITKVVSEVLPKRVFGESLVGNDTYIINKEPFVYNYTATKSYIEELNNFGKNN